MAYSAHEPSYRGFICTFWATKLCTAWDANGYIRQPYLHCWDCLWSSNWTSRCGVEWSGVEWRGMWPLLYSNYPICNPFGSTIQYFGFVAAIWQCFHSSVGYVYSRKNAENPIKMTIMFLFRICLIVSKIVNKYSTRTLKS